MATTLRIGHSGRELTVEELQQYERQIETTLEPFLDEFNNGGGYVHLFFKEGEEKPAVSYDFPPGIGELQQKIAAYHKSTEKRP